MLAPIQIHEPSSVQEASALLARLGDEAAIYAGGTELLVVMKERIAHFPHLIDIKTISGLDEIRLDGDDLVIGALATHREIERSPVVREHAPLLAEVEARIANVRVRAAGTIGGNLCFAEPHSDPATLLIAWDARLTLVSDSGARTVPAVAFFTGLLETIRRPEEILTEIRIAIPRENAFSAYERFKIHERPTATAAVNLTTSGGPVSDARVVVGSVAAFPARIDAAEQRLIGRSIDAATIEAASEIASNEIEPTEDAFESVEYKRQIVRVLVRKALESVAEGMKR